MQMKRQKKYWLPCGRLVDSENWFNSQRTCWCCIMWVCIVGSNSQYNWSGSLFCYGQIWRLSWQEQCYFHNRASGCNGPRKNLMMRRGGATVKKRQRWAERRPIVAELLKYLDICRSFYRHVFFTSVSPERALKLNEKSVYWRKMLKSQRLRCSYLAEQLSPKVLKFLRSEYRMSKKSAPFLLLRVLSSWGYRLIPIDFGCCRAGSGYSWKTVNVRCVPKPADWKFPCGRKRALTTIISHRRELPGNVTWTKIWLSMGGWLISLQSKTLGSLVLAHS